MDVPVALDGHHEALGLQPLQQLAEAGRPEGHARRQRRGPHAGKSGLADVLVDDLGGAAAVEQRQVAHQRLAADPRRVEVQHRAAADGHHRGVRAHHVAVARQGHRGRLEPESRQRPAAGLELRTVQQEHTGHDLAGAHVDPDVAS
jgi:hypothetical protein